MKCKVCGANNEDYLEYCEKCAAPLTGSAEAADNTGSASREQRSWGFVSSPNWSKPDFSANTVSEEDIPADYQPQSFRPRYNAVQQSAPEPAVKRNSVRTSAKPAPEAFCPHCGAAVQGSQRFCNECGQRMDEPASNRAAGAPATATFVGATSVGATSVGATSVGATSAVGSAASGSVSSIKYADPIGDDMFSFNYEEDEDERPRKKKGGRKTASSKPASRPTGSRSRKRGGLALDRTLLFWIAAAVLVIALVVMGIMLANKSGGFGNLFGGLFSSSAVTKEPLVEKTSTENGDPAYNITVYAKKGSIVRFEGGSIKHDTEVTQSAPVILSIPEAVWVPSEPVEGDKLEVYPNITVIAKDGTETPLTFAEPIVINIPTLSLAVTAPNTPSFETATPDVTISGVVEDPTSAVYANDMQLTVDESGNFEGSYTLSAEGETTINVEARKNGYAIARQTFAVNYSTTSAATPTGGATAPTGGATAPTGGAAATPGTLPAGATALAYANTADLNVRSQPSTGSADTILGKLSLNQKVYVIEKDAGNAWAKVLYNGSEAYISNLLINMVDNYTVKDATIIEDQLNGRASASSSAESIVKFPLNTKVSYIKDVGSGWSMIEYDGKILFAATNYISIG